MLLSSTPCAVSLTYCHSLHIASSLDKMASLLTSESSLSAGVAAVIVVEHAPMEQYSEMLQLIILRICKESYIHAADFATLMWYNFVRSQGIKSKFIVKVVK